jgi:Chitobiase/beta-hexosaminidase C-terminal domain
MINLLQIQKDVFGLLMSAPQLATVSIALEQKFILQAELQADSVWQIIRNGKSGNGVLIEIPEIESTANNVSGPPQTVILKFVSFQNGDAALVPNSGSGLFAEEVEQFILDALHLQSFGKFGTIQVDGKFSSPARDYPGVNARRLTLKIKPLASRQTPRTAPVNCALQPDGVTMVLNCTTPGATIVYTLDGSFPSNPAVAIDPLSNQPVNAQSKVYAAPFQLPPGATLRAAAYAPGMNPGEIISYP